MPQQGTNYGVVPTSDGVIDSPPAVSGDMVYLANRRGGLFLALDASTGEEVWSMSTGETLNGSSPVISDGVVYAAIPEDGIYALDAETGEQVWFMPLTNVTADPTVSGGRLYVATDDGLSTRSLETAHPARIHLSLKRAPIHRCLQYQPS